MTNSIILSSYMKSILTQSNCVPTIILERTQSFKEKQLNQEKNTTPELKQENIDAIFLGPFQPFIKRIFHALSTIAHLRQQTSTHNETIFKQHQTNTNSIPLEKLKKISHHDTERVFEKLKHAIIKHNNQYSEKTSSWFERIKTSLAKEDLTLSENEETELHKLYPISEMLSILNDMKIEYTSLKKAQHYDFKHYIKLKCRLAIYSCLNKKQELCDDTTIKAYLKKIKHELTTIHKEEVSFLKSVEKEYNEILSAITFAKIHK
jgi:hypothetical protein